MKLFVGTIFKQTFQTEKDTISFKVLSIDEQKNFVKVLCHKEGCEDWEEEWDDLETVYSAILNEDYKIIEQGFPKKEPIELMVENTYLNNDYYIQPTQRDLPFFKRKGSAKKRR